MSETKFTPGPWVAIIHPDQVPKAPYEIACLPHPDLDAIDIAINGKRDGWGTLEQLEANASLIAAAPDLYEALAAAIECGMVPKSSASDGGAYRYSSRVKVADMIRAALAKARGET